MNPIVFDVDGTLLHSVFHHLSPRIHVAYVLNPFIDPSEVTHVCTGRHESLRAETTTQLAEYNICPVEIRMNPVKRYDHNYLADMKSGHLRDLGAEIYVDDDPVFNRHIRERWKGMVLTSDELWYLKRDPVKASYPSVNNTFHLMKSGYTRLSNVKGCGNNQYHIYSIQE